MRVYTDYIGLLNRTCVLTYEIRAYTTQEKKHLKYKVVFNYSSFLHILHGLITKF